MCYFCQLFIILKKKIHVYIPNFITTYVGSIIVTYILLKVVEGDGTGPKDELQPGQVGGVFFLDGGNDVRASIHSCPQRFNQSHFFNNYYR